MCAVQIICCEVVHVDQMHVYMYTYMHIYIYFSREWARAFLPGGSLITRRSDFTPPPPSFLNRGPRDILYLAVDLSLVIKYDGKRASAYVVRGGGWSPPDADNEESPGLNSATQIDDTIIYNIVYIGSNILRGPEGRGGLLHFFL